VIFEFPYKIMPLGGGGVSATAVLNVQIARPAKNAPRTKRFEAIIDSGASRCLFHASVGEFIGLDIERGEVEDTLGINGTSREYLHDIVIYLPGGSVNIRAGFSDQLPVAGLLGMNGFFEHFKVTFDPLGKACILERLYQV
jgi:hypothetical protein